MWGEAELGVPGRGQARVKGLGLRGAGRGPEQLESVTDCGGWWQGAVELVGPGARLQGGQRKDNLAQN